MKNTNIKISAVFDYVIEIEGEFDYENNQLFCLENDPNTKVMVISATKNKAYCLGDKTADEYKVGQKVKPIEQSTTITTSSKLFGSVIDIFSNVLYSKNTNTSEYVYPNTSSAFNKPNQLMDYLPLNEQLNTGYKVIDLLIPIGRGQRELIIGDRKTGKSFIALNTIINQRNENVKNIYVMIGQQQNQVASVYEMLDKYSALNNTIIIYAPADKPYQQYLAPYIGMAHAENIAHEEDVLIVFDDLTTHANIYREMALLTNKPVGKEAFPGDMFFAHSRLLERSGKFVNKKSITALPIVQTVDNDITSLIASNLISITDGQIVTNSNIFASNKLPAIDVDLSVSRIGGSVQKPHIAKSASEIKKIYTSYKRQMKLSSLKYDLNDKTGSLILRGQLIERLFNQKGVSLYSEKNTFLFSKMISWGLLEHINEVDLALKFLNVLIKENQIASSVFEQILSNTIKDEELAKDFFAFSLDQFAKAKNLKWKLKFNHDFVKFETEEFKNIVQLTGE
ncbi:ATP F0F1 synthase subunit alpha [Mycoplasmopsis ciconiae]|uniref:ATP F0F1 synthase subunit alpha n=1 Tax=Mycoplasmopsis ciconiae TaxID=561067 RepID=A0ABU7MKX4_9BACT|nr:ATP F0F1 synthase subunit alpha [Mycoplasmopsis ciconiae]